MNQQSAYEDTIRQICSRLAPGQGVLDVPFGLFEEIASFHGIDPIDVIKDLQLSLAEETATREIEAGHVFHSEPYDAMSPEDLLGYGMIDSRTALFNPVDFIEHVRCGHLSDNDGYGEFVSGDGREFLPIRCHAGWLEEFRDEWAYIAWFDG